jgi:hypothetical protein
MCLEFQILVKSSLQCASGFWIQHVRTSSLRQSFKTIQGTLYLNNFLEQKDFLCLKAQAYEASTLCKDHFIAVQTIQGAD